MADKSGVSPQAVSLPAGGGDIRGLGETFQPDLNSGTGNYRVPLEVLPGVRKFQPTLELMYSTGAGNSAWGLGWGLPILTVSRRTFRGIPTYDDSQDVFLYGGATELVEVAPQTYQVAVENSFARFVRTASGWEVTEKSGIRHTFGQTPESRIEFDEDGKTHVFAWLIERSEDTLGNAISYHYRQEGTQRYLQEVRYAIYTIRFEYEARPDPFSEFRSGFELRTTLRCSRITLHVQTLGMNAVRIWLLEYTQSPLSTLSLLSRVTFSGYDPETGMTADLPPLEFSYTGFDPSKRRYQRFASKVGVPPPGLDNGNADLIDLDGHGLPGVLSVENGQPRYWPNRGQLGWEPPRELQQFPAAFSLGDDRVQFADMDGNGAADLLVGNGPFSGYYENDGHGHWKGFNHYTRSPGFAFEESDIQLLDVNGDGLVDAVHAGRTGLQVYENRGSAGWEPPHLVPQGDPTTTPPSLSQSNPRVRLADMNGDGLLDVILIASGRIACWSSRGNGRFAAGRVLTSSPHFPYPFDPKRVFLTDINGDGLADVVYVGYDEVTYWINQSGNSFSPPHTIRYTPPTSLPATLRVADMNGTGTAGLLWTSPYPDYRYLDFTGGVKPGLLERIDNHLGGITSIAYTTSTQQALADQANGQAWDSFLPFAVQVVASVTVEDRISGLHSVTSYRYHEGHYDGHLREFDGFARAEQIEVGDASMPTAITVFHYHTEASARTLMPDPDLRRTLKRKLYRVEVYGQDGAPTQDQPYRVEESQWAVQVEHSLPNGQKVLFPYVTETSISTFERGTSARIERRAFTFDQYGNVLSEERKGEGDPSSQLYLKTLVEYAHNITDWIVDRPTRIVQRDEQGKLLSEMRHYYDGPDFQGLPFGQVTKGLLSRMEKVAFHQVEAAAIYGTHLPDFAALGYHTGQDVDGQPAWNVDHERYQMDAQGNVITSQDGRGNTTHFAFDAFGLFATSSTDAKGFINKVEPEYRVGKPRRTINANGGMTEIRYDPLGRIVKVASPGDTLVMPTAAYTYDTSVSPAARTIEYRVFSGQAQTVHVYEYANGSGSVFQQRVEHDGTTFVVGGHVLLNARGKISEKYEPSFATGGSFQLYNDDPAAPHRQFFYDALGRPVMMTNLDGGQTRAVYETWRTLFYDPGDTDATTPTSFNTPRSEQYDAWQRLVAVQERDTNTVYTTSYLLDPPGHLRQVTDARGVVPTQISYDLLGRRIAIQHVDAGQRLIAYDARGNVVLTVDATGQTIRHTHDELNRVLETIYRGVTAEHYVYDRGPGPNLVGQLVTVTDPSGQTTYSYDERGYIVERTRVVPGQPTPFTFGYTYDRLGRVTQLTYPDTVSVEVEYYSGLLPQKIAGYVDAIEYTAAGKRSAIAYANGVRTEYDYNSTTSRLSEIKTWRPSTGEIYFHTSYAMSKEGNITSILDLRPSAPGLERTENLAYDAFDQLTHAGGFDSSGNYTHDYTYDAVGNILSNPLLSAHPLVYSDGTNRLQGYNDGINIISLFDYDANGNMTSTPGRTLSFDPRQQLERAQLSSGVDVRFFYDFSGMLARKELSLPEGSSTTLYFDNLYEVQDTTALRWVILGDLPIARESNGTKTFLHNDHLGSTVVYTDAAGKLLTEAAYYPFGALALPPTAGALPLFTTKRLDADIGLYYFNARWYAPDLGRFISPDPLYLVQPERGVQEPKRLNPYAYAGNNPLRFVDPNGLSFWDVVASVAAVVAAVVVLPAAVYAAVYVAGGALVLAGAASILGGGIAGAAIGFVVGGIAYGTWGGAAQGALIGFTAGFNMAAGGLLFGSLAGTAFGSLAGTTLGVITFLSIFPGVAKDDTYKGILGWSSYLMPMSWPLHTVGLTLFALNILGSLVTFRQLDDFKVTNVRVDWEKGVIHTEGGWINKLNLQGQGSGALSIGNFVWFRQGQFNETTLQHEEGHSLNNAAFGVFQLYNALDQSIINNGSGAYFERLAESNVAGGGRSGFRQPLRQWSAGSTGNEPATP